MDSYKEDVLSTYSNQPEEKRKYIARLLAEVKAEYTLNHSAANPEDAVRTFLNDILTSKTEFPASICTAHEIENILMPNILLERYGMVYMKPQERENFFHLRQSMGIARIRSRFKEPISLQTPDTSVQIRTKESRKHNAIEMISVEEVKISTSGKIISLEEIKSILSTGGRYKVCIVAP